MHSHTPEEERNAMHFMNEALDLSDEMANSEFLNIDKYGAKKIMFALTLLQKEFKYFMIQCARDKTRAKALIGSLEETAEHIASSDLSKCGCGIQHTKFGNATVIPLTPEIADMLKNVITKAAKSGNVEIATDHKDLFDKMKKQDQNKDVNIPID